MIHKFEQDLRSYDETNNARRVTLVGDYSGLLTSRYDTITCTYPDTLTEVYTYSSGGTTTGTITVVYTTACKQFISSVVRS